MKFILLRAERYNFANSCDRLFPNVGDLSKHFCWSIFDGHYWGEIALVVYSRQKNKR